MFLTGDQLQTSSELQECMHQLAPDAKAAIEAISIGETRDAVIDLLNRNDRVG